MIRPEKPVEQRTASAYAALTERKEEYEGRGEKGGWWMEVKVMQTLIAEALAKIKATDPLRLAKRSAPRNRN